MLAHRRVPRIAALLGVLLTLPALRAGLNGDDYYHRVILLQVDPIWSEARPMLDLFSLVPGDERNEALAEAGIVSWWAHPQVRINLFRPLGALTHILDYALWPDSAPLQHLHSVFWYGLTILFVALLYRDVQGASVGAGLAALLWAVDDSHAMPAGWLANRHALLSVILGVAALLCHVRWRRGGGASWGVGAILSLGLSLFSGEAALGAAAYLFAWQVTMDDASWLRRLVVLTPYALFVVAWRVVYNVAGYGTNGTGLYIDPGRHPVEFLTALGERWPVLQLGQWFQVPLDLTIALTREQQLGLALLALALLVPLIGLMAPLVKERREARFWALGLCLSLVPMCAAFPMDRLLLFCGIGAFGLLALMAERWTVLFGSRKPGTGRRLGVGALLVLHGPLAAALLVARVVSLPLFGSFFAMGTRTAPADDQVAEQTLIFMNGQEFPVAYTSIIRQAEGAYPAPRRLALLSSITSDVQVSREDEDTLVLTAERGFLAEPVDLLLRSLDLPFEVGDTLERPDFQAEVRSITDDGRPETVAFHFRATLEAPSYRWLYWSPSGAQPFSLPSEGETVELPSVNLLPSS